MRTVVKLRIGSIAADHDIAASPEALRRNLSAALEASLTAQISGATVQWPVTASSGVRSIARQATETAASQGALSLSRPASPTTGGAGS